MPASCTFQVTLINHFNNVCHLEPEKGTIFLKNQLKDGHFFFAFLILFDVFDIISCVMQGKDSLLNLAKGSMVKVKLIEMVSGKRMPSGNCKDRVTYSRA